MQKNNELDVFGSKFSYDIYMNRYSLNQIETWSDTCKRNISSVCGQHLNNEAQQFLYEMMYDRVFIPAGRYLASAGRPMHNICNCFALAAEDSREGWAELLQKVTMMLSLGGGVGVEYSKVRGSGEKITRTGGLSSGPIALMEMVNEVGRHIKSGSMRRSALWAGLLWSHKDILHFIKCKNRTELQQTINDTDPLFPLPLDGTNISVTYDSEFFRAMENKEHPLHKHAKEVWSLNCKQAFSTAEPGFSFNFLKDTDILRNACQPSYATVITPDGIRTMGDIDVGSKVWDGMKYVTVIKKWCSGVKPVYKYTTTMGEFIGTDNHRVLSQGKKEEVKNVDSIDSCIGPKAPKMDLNNQDVMDGLVVGDGSVHKASNNLVYLCIGEKDYDYFDDDICSLITKERSGLSSSAYEITTTIKADELPKTYDRFVPDRFFYGDRRTQCGFLRGLFSANGSINGNRVCLKQSSYKLIKQVQLMLSNLGIHSYITTNKSTVIKFKNGKYRCKESYDINISSGRDAFKNTIGFIQKYKQDNIVCSSAMKNITSSIKSIELLESTDVYEITVDSKEHVYWTGGCLVSNCTEYTTDEDSDSCNLGSIYLNRIKSKEHLAHVTKYATAFLMCGGIYTDCPTIKCREMRDKNNRIGLGLGGIAEWMAYNGGEYTVSPDLHKLLSVWQQESDSASYMWAKELGVAIPKAKRAIAPNGTTSIIAETTGGIEPIFCKAYKRRYYEGDKYQMQYVVDASIKRMIDNGIDVSKIQDAYDITFKDRVKVQADFQKYVDMAISSTCNLPSWGSEKNNEETLKEYSRTLLKYAPRLRGFTCYPNASRGGQPLQRCSIEEAISNEGKVFEFHEANCASGSCSA